MLILLLTAKVSEGQAVNVMFYIQDLNCLCKRIAHVSPEMWSKWKFFFLHYTMNLHTAAITSSFWPKKEWHS